MTRSDTPPEEISSLPYNLRSRQGRSNSQTPQKNSSSTKATAGLSLLDRTNSHPQPSSSESAQLESSKDKPTGSDIRPSTLTDVLGKVPLEDQLSIEDQLSNGDATAAQAPHDNNGACSNASPAPAAISANSPAIDAGAPLQRSAATSQPQHETPSRDMHFASPVRGLIHQGVMSMQPLVPYLSPTSPAPSHEEEVFSTPEVTDQDLMARVRDCQPTGPWQRLAASEEQGKQLQQDLDAAHATITAHQKQLSAMLEQKKHDACQRTAEVGGLRLLTSCGKNGHIRLFGCRDWLLDLMVHAFMHFPASVAISLNIKHSEHHAHSKSHRT